jgi:hypothetical protein
MSDDETNPNPHDDTRPAGDARPRTRTTDEIEITVGDVMDEEARADAEEAAARDPSPTRRAALADLDPGEITPRMIDHDVRFAHLTDEMRREAKEIRGFSTAETPPPEGDDHDLVLDEAALEAEYGNRESEALAPEPGEPLQQGEADVLVHAASGGTPSASAGPSSDESGNQNDARKTRDNSDAETTEHTASDPDATPPVGGSSTLPDGHEDSDRTETPDGSNRDAHDDRDDEDDEDDTPESRTLAETGLVDDDDQFPWEAEEEGVVKTEAGEREQIRFEYVGTPFEITEPDDRQQLENAADSLTGIQDAGKPERDRKIEEYFEHLADMCLTVDDTPYDELYVIERPNGKKDLLTQATAAKYGLVGTTDNDARASADGGTSVAEDLGVTVTPLWEALTPFQRQKLGQKMDRFTSGEDSFRPRFR